MQITIREPGSAITHFIGMMMAMIAATPLMVKAAAGAVEGNHAADKHGHGYKGDRVGAGGLNHKRRGRYNSHHHTDKMGDGASGFTNGNLHNKTSLKNPYDPLQEQCGNNNFYMWFLKLRNAYFNTIT